MFFSRVALEDFGAAPPMAGLAPLAVDPTMHERGIGSALVRAGLERCPAAGWELVFVVGAPAYYARFGFVPAAEHGFSYGDAVLDRALQVVELRGSALSGLRGLVRYHPLFAEIEKG